MKVGKVILDSIYVEESDGDGDDEDDQIDPTGEEDDADENGLMQEHILEVNHFNVVPAPRRISTITSALVADIGGELFTDQDEHGQCNIGFNRWDM